MLLHLQSVIQEEYYLVLRLNFGVLASEARPLIAGNCLAADALFTQGAL